MATPLVQATVLSLWTTAITSYWFPALPLPPPPPHSLVSTKQPGRTCENVSLIMSVLAQRPSDFSSQSEGVWGPQKVQRPSMIRPHLPPCLHLQLFPLSRTLGRCHTGPLAVPGAQQACSARGPCTCRSVCLEDCPLTATWPARSSTSFLLSRHSTREATPNRLSAPSLSTPSSAMVFT